MILPIYHAGKFSWDEALVLVAIMAALPLITWYRSRRDSAARPPQSPPQGSTPDDPAA